MDKVTKVYVENDTLIWEHAYTISITHDPSPLDEWFQSMLLELEEEYIRRWEGK